jgi:chromosome segregation ATPase
MSSFSRSGSPSRSHSQSPSPRTRSRSSRSPVRQVLAANASLSSYSRGVALENAQLRDKLSIAAQNIRALNVFAVQLAVENAQLAGANRINSRAAITTPAPSTATDVLSTGLPQLQQRLADSKLDNDRLVAAAVESKAEIERLRSGAAESAAELSRLRQAVATANADAERSRNSASGPSTTEARLRDAAAESNVESARWRTAAVESKADAERWQRALSESDADRARLRETVADLKAENSRVVAAARAESSAAAVARAEGEESARVLAAANADTTRLQQSLQRSQEAARLLERDAKARVVELDDLRRALSESNARVAAATNEVDALRRDDAQRPPTAVVDSGEVTRLRALVGEREADVSNLQQEARRNERQLAQARQESADAERTVSDAITRAKASDAKVAAITQSSQRQIRAAEASAGRLTSEIDDLKSELADAGRQRSAAESKAATANARSTAAEAKIRSLTDDNAALRASSENLRSSEKKLQAELALARTEAEDAKYQSDEKLYDAQARLKALLDPIAALAGENSVYAELPEYVETPLSTAFAESLGSKVSGEPRYRLAKSLAQVRRAAAATDYRAIREQICRNAS